MPPKNFERMFYKDTQKRDTNRRLSKIRKSIHVKNEKLNRDLEKAIQILEMKELRK